MAARGSAEKEFVMAKLMEVFPNAFMNGKEFRIPVMNGNEEIQIKVTLTAAKDNVAHAETADAPVAEKQEPKVNLTGPDEKEKSSVAELLNLIGAM